MELTDDDIHALVQEIWDSYLQLDVSPGGPVEMGDATVSSVIHIHGDWEGTVVIQASGGLANRIASAMFGLPPDDLETGDVHDAVGEIVNMLGGSVKSLVDGEASLSLPTVIGGAGQTVAIPGAQACNHAWFQTAGQPLTVQILQRATAEVAA